MSTRIEYPHINEFIGLNKFVLYEMGWDPVKIREEWNKGLGRHGIKDVRSAYVNKFYTE